MDPYTYLPGDFIDRGVRTPFTTKSLRYSRLITLKGERPLVTLPGLAGGLGTYEMPLSTLHDVFDLSVHDRMLFEHLVDLEAVTPQNVSSFSQAIAMTGVGGVELARHAIKADQEDRQALAEAQLSVLHQAFVQLGSDEDVQTLAREDLATRDGQIIARKSLNRFAQENGISVSQVIDNLAEWATMTAPVGLAVAGCEGRLRLLDDRLAKLSSVLGEWMTSEQAEYRFMTMHVLNSIDATHEHCLRFIRHIDRLTNNLSNVLTRWDKVKEEISDMITHLWWLLDGWDELARVWERKPQNNRFREREVVEEIASFMPVLPVRELEECEYDFWIDIRVNQMLWVAELRKLGSGEVDTDMMDRLERYRRQV